MNFIDQAKKFSTGLQTGQMAEKMVYHDIAYTHRLIGAIEEIVQFEAVSEEEREVLLITGWMINTGFSQLDADQSFSNLEEFFTMSYGQSIQLTEDFLTDIGYPEDQTKSVITLIQESKPQGDKTSHLTKILSDAITMDWGNPKSKGRVKKLYEEFLLVGAVSYGKGTWYDTVLRYLREHEFLTDYVRRNYEDGKLELITKIEKEKKDLNKTANIILKKEMNITDDELKRLKKSLSSVKGRDDRGIQTMFRTTSRNHYTLSQMVDRKANIVISINAILLSLIISRTIGQIDTFCIHNSPILIMLITSMMSMIFAVLSIIPFKTQGTFTEKQIREKEGNLLYYGNIHKMNYRDFEWGMLEMLNDGNFLYSSMIRDLYFLGKTLHKKSRLIRISLALFILGLAVSTMLFMIVSSMSDYHFGSATHL